MAAIKPLVASALLALLLIPAALADSYPVKLDPDDQAWATRALLRQSDLAFGWRGGAVRSGRPDSPSCPGFDPKVSDLVVTGRASVSFVNPRIQAQISVDSDVLESEEAVRTDFARTVTPDLRGCLAFQLLQTPDVTAVTVEPLRFPKIGGITAAYRATITIRTNGRQAKLLSDYVFLGNGRMEFSMNVVAPAAVRSLLVPFEADVARLLVKRGTRPE